MTRLPLLVGLACALAACGGGGDDDGAEAGSSLPAQEAIEATDGTEPEQSNSDGSAEPDTESDTEPAAESSIGAGKAVVTIGDETYEADLSGDLTVCVSMGGAIAASGPIDGIDGGRIKIDLPPEDYETSSDDGWEPPSVRVDLGEDDDGVPIGWAAAPDVAELNPDFAGSSQVDSFSVDDASASGTATFIDDFQILLFNGGQVEEPQPVQGSFQVSCG